MIYDAKLEENEWKQSIFSPFKNSWHYFLSIWMLPRLIKLQFSLQRK